MAEAEEAVLEEAAVVVEATEVAEAIEAEATVDTTDLTPIPDPEEAEVKLDLIKKLISFPMINQQHRNDDCLSPVQ